MGVLFSNPRQNFFLCTDISVNNSEINNAAVFTIYLAPYFVKRGIVVESSTLRTDGAYM